MRKDKASANLRILYALLAAMSVAAAGGVYLFDPRDPGLYPVCPFFGLTGCYCPGCGTLRAVHQLMHGRVAAAFGYNLYAMLTLPVVGYSFTVGGLRAYGLPAPPRMFVPVSLIWMLMAAILAFWVLRNLPFPPFVLLAPQPL